MWHRSEGDAYRGAGGLSSAGPLSMTCYLSQQGRGRGAGQFGARRFGARRRSGCSGVVKMQNACFVHGEFVPVSTLLPKLNRVISKESTVEHAARTMQPKRITRKGYCTDSPASLSYLIPT